MISRLTMWVRQSAVSIDRCSLVRWAPRAFLLTFLGIITALQIGCASVLPVHEAEPPETLGAWGFQIGQFAGAAPVVATNTVTGTRDVVAYSIQGGRLGVGLGESFQLNADIFVGLLSAGGTIALKYQFLGSPLFKAKAGDSSAAVVLSSTSSSAAEVTSDLTGDP